MVAVCQQQSENVDAFQPSSTTFSVAPPPTAFLPRTSQTLYSSVGGGGDQRPPPEDDGNDDDDEGMKDFLANKKESEDLKKAREYMAERSLPISFDNVDDDNSDNNKDQAEDDDKNVMEEVDETVDQVLDEKNSTMVGSPAPSPSLFPSEDAPSADLLAKNPYMQVVSKLSPSELISKFTASTSPRVQDAVRATILGLIGSLPKMAFDTTTITTGQRLASLMFQLQMTGYMFKNAEYRSSLSQSLGMSTNVGQSSNYLLAGDAADDDDAEDKKDRLLAGKISGKLKIRYGGAKGEGEKTDGESSLLSGLEMEVDAAAYMSELRSEVSRLKEELGQTRDVKEEALQKDLLVYIRTLPKQELKSLTNTMSQDVLVCMKGLVQAVLEGVGEGEIGPDTVTEQSGEAMAQLCMWQLAVGFNLRELEVREEMKKSLNTFLGDEGSSGVDFSEPGAME
jgi:hypothetical protein